MGRFNSMIRAFSAHEGLHKRVPWALPTAQMNHAVGVKKEFADPAVGNYRQVGRNSSATVSAASD